MRRMRRATKLQCNECGHEFEGPAWYVGFESHARVNLEWILDSDPTRGVRCPSCGTTLLKVNTTKDPRSPGSF